MSISKRNVGKIFETNFKKSIPDYCMIQRLNDPPQGFIESSTARFAPKNPCDYIIFDSKGRILYCLELKTTKYKSISFEDVNEEKQSEKMIHKHQILGLLDMSKHDHVCAGFVCNFRDEEKGLERTYYQSIQDFLKMVDGIGKKSFNEMDLILNGAIKIIGKKYKVNHYWDVDGFMEKMRNEE